MVKLIEQLEQRNDNAKKYQRRLCLRISGIDMEPNKTSESCLEKLKEVFSELRVDILDLAIDRAHQIGRNKTVNRKPNRQMIVRFTM